MSTVINHGSIILFVTAEPGDQDRLDTGEEYRLIEDAVRDKFQLRVKLAARPEDLTTGLVDYRPAVLHFSGHGAGAKGLLFQKAKGKSKLLAKAALEALFETNLLETVHLVVLNACSTEAQAKLIAEKGCDVVAMRWDVLDTLAREFASYFYRTLCKEAPEDAFKITLAWLKAKSVPEPDTPVFVKGKQREPGKPQRGPTGKINQGALRRFIFEKVPEDALANIEADIPDYRQAMGATLNHKEKPERARRIVAWLAERQRLPELLEKLHGEVPDLMQQHKAGLYS